MINNPVYILKGRFKAMTTNTFGLFIIFINDRTKTIENMMVIASHFSSLYENDPDLPWSQFEAKIKQLKWDGEISANLSNDFQTLFVNSFLSDVIEQFIDAFKINKFTKPEHIIVTLIEKILADKNISLQLETEIVSKDEITRTREEIDQQNKKEHEDTTTTETTSNNNDSTFNIEDGGVLLNIDLILGPVSGIPIYEIKPGDQIVVKIAGRTQKEQYFIDLLHAKSETGDILPIKAVVKEIKENPDNNEYKLLVEIGPGIYGIATEQERVKLKKYDPLSDTKVVNSQQNKFQKQENYVPTSSVTSSSKSSNLLFIWIIGAVTLILAILFFIFFL